MKRPGVKTAANAVLIFLCSCATSAQARPWIVDYAHSQLGFTGTQGTTPFNGLFKQFTATIDFDPDHPETGKITAVIDMASATTGDADRDGALPQAAWFDTKDFPQARFVSSRIQKTAPNTYEADGIVTIKGVSHPVAFPFSLAKEEGHTRATGIVQLIRSDFNIGTGQWSNEAYVKFAVGVKIDIAAQPAP